MDWDDLKYFLAVARTGSLTEAARALKASAATVGRHVESLETHLDARLFEHRSTGYVLTDIGGGILRRAQAVEEAVLSVQREADSSDQDDSGKVRVACTEDMASMVIVPNLGPFRASHPSITLELIAGLSMVNLTRRDADVAMRSVRPEAGDLMVRRIGAVDLAVYASRSYVAQRGIVPDAIDWSRLETITWVEEMAGLRGGPWLAEHAAGSRVAIQANTSRLLYAACQAGLGAAVLPCFGGDRDPELVCIVSPQAVQSLDLWLVVHRDLATVPRIRAVMDYLVELGPKFSRQKLGADNVWT